jgi:hypothetical protein
VPAAEIDEFHQQVVTLEEQRVEAGPALVNRIAQPEQTAADQDRDEHQQCGDHGHGDPDHDGFEYIIGASGALTGWR